MKLRLYGSPNFVNTLRTVSDNCRGVQSGVRKWINPNGASAERVIEQVKKCPSGALSFFYNEKGK